MISTIDSTSITRISSFFAEVALDSLLPIEKYRSGIVLGAKLDFERAFSQLTYQLLYPGVLGSMIFNLVDPLRGFSPAWLCSIIICMCFVLDYLYLTLHLLPSGKAPNVAQAASDLVISLLFCCSYFAIARTSAEFVSEEMILASAKLSLGFLLSAQSVIFMYDVVFKKSKRFIDFFHLMGSFSGLVFLLAFGDRFGVYRVVVLSASFVLVVYSIRLATLKVQESRKMRA
nr:hypothetical protein [uncultured Hyphomonas sp.]